MPEEHFFFIPFHYSGCFITLCNLHCGKGTISTAEIEGNNKSAFVKNIKDIISLGKENGGPRRTRRKKDVLNEEL